MKKSSKRSTSIKIAAMLCGLTTVVGSASAGLHQVSGDELIIGTDIGTRYRIYVDVNAGDHIDELFGRAVEPIMMSPVIGAAIFQLLDLQSWPKEIRAALLGNSTSTVPLDRPRLAASTPFSIPIGSDRKEPIGSLNTIRGSFAFRGSSRGDTLSSGTPPGNLRTVPFRSIDTPLIVPAPGAIALLSLAGVTYRRRRK